MKYYELIKIEGKTPEPIVIPVPKVDPAVDNTTADNNALGAIADDIKEVKSLIAELKNNTAVAPPEASSSSLTNDEIADVLGMLIEFRNKYFSYTPLATEIPKNLLWNIPKAVYEATVTMRKENCPDCLNPMYWIYACFLADPAYMMPMFVKLAWDSISTEDFNKIDELLQMVQDDYIEMGYTFPELTEDDQEAETSEEEEESEEKSEEEDTNTDDDLWDVVEEDDTDVEENTTSDNNKSDTPVPMFKTTTDVKPVPVSTTPTPTETDTKEDTTPTTPASNDMYDVLMNGYEGDDVADPDPNDYPEFNPNSSNEDDEMVVDKHSDNVGEITKA